MKRVITTIAAFSLLTGGVLAADDDLQRRAKELGPKEFAEYLVRETGSFWYNEDHPFLSVDEQQARLEPDAVLRTCSAYRNKPPAEVAQRLSQEARESIKYPEGGIELGDWERGHLTAFGGYGWRLGHSIDDHRNRRPTGGCYNCHQLDPRQAGAGTIGPSLSGYGVTRGDTPQTRKFVWDVIYNSHASFPCSVMPRHGHNQVLEMDQIQDLLAYLLDPKSPVNKYHAGQ